MNTCLVKTDESPVLLVARYGETPPRNRIVIDDVTHEGVDTVGWTFGAYLLAELIEIDKAPPGEFFHHASEAGELVGTTYTITHTWDAWTQTEIDAEMARRRDAAIEQVDNFEDVIRATILVIMDEFNRHSVVHTAILQAAADATSLADFKTRMAAITPIPARTIAQLRDAVRAKLGT